MLKPVGKLCWTLLLTGGAGAFAQQYTISTAAGGAPPSTPVTASNISIGPPNRVAVDGAGNVYFSSLNSVFKVSGGGTLMLVAGNSRAGFSGDGGPATAAQLNSPQGLAVDSSGDIYIADSGNNRIREVLASGIIVTFAGTGAISPGGPNTFNDGGPATLALLHRPLGVAVDSSGNVYIADTGDNLIRKVTTDGNIATIAGNSYPSFAGDTHPATEAEFHTPSDIAVDSKGNLYIADTQNAAIREITTDGLINTVAGDAAIGFSGDAGEAIKAGLIAPVSVAVDSAGNYYIAENGDSRIRKVDTSGNINTIAGNGSPAFAGDGSAALSAQLNYPTGVAVDSSGNLYIADSLNLRVRKISGSNISTVAGNGVISYSGDGGPALAAQLNAPLGVAVDAGNNIYIADTNNNAVRLVNTSGVISNYAGNNGKAGSSGDNGAATSAQLNGPEGLAVDASGNLYIADTLNARVRKVTPGGAISTVAGSGTPGYGGDGGAATSAQLNYPVSVAVDGSGNLYIADFSNSRVRKVAAATGVITTFAGNGSAGYSGDGGQATSAQISTPQGVAVDPSGNLYIADTANNVIRLVNTSGIISTVVGNGTAGYSGDGGPAAAAQTGNPTGVAVDAQGNIYISDGSSRVRKVYFTGAITTLAGTGTRGYSGDGGLSTSATLNSPTALAVSASGNVLVADSGNSAVRVLQFAGFGLKLGAVTNGATNTVSAIAPGEVVVLYGSGLGPAQLTKYQVGGNGLVGTNLAGTSVFVNGAPAPVLYTSATQVGAVAPFALGGTSAQVFVQYQGQSSGPLTVPVATASPALFTVGSGTGPAAAVNNKTGAVNDAAHPANAGDYIQLYATGTGQTNPPGVDGLPAALPLPQPLLPITVTIGGKNAPVQYAGGAPTAVAGVTQINAQIPSGLAAGAAPVVVKAGTFTTQAGVTVAVSGN